jgi:hypothetical protein
MITEIVGAGSTDMGKAKGFEVRCSKFDVRRRKQVEV